jgi:hypothetical protein
VKAIRNARHVVARKPMTIYYLSVHSFISPACFAYSDTCDVWISLDNLIRPCTIWRHCSAVKDLPCHRVARYKCKMVVAGDGISPPSSQARCTLSVVLVCIIWPPVSTRLMRHSAALQPQLDGLRQSAAL